MTSKDPEDLRVELRRSPRFEQASKSYVDLLSAMRTALEARLPGLTWDRPAPFQDGQAGCSKPYVDVSGTIEVVFEAGAGSCGVPDDLWPAVRQDLIDLAAKQGFTKVVSVLDKPGDHSVVIYDQWGGSFEFGAQKATTLAIFTPCLLHDGY